MKKMARRETKEKRQEKKRIKEQLQLQEERTKLFRKQKKKKMYKEVISLISTRHFHNIKDKS